MWRLPYFNLCLVLFLIAVYFLQRANSLSDSSALSPAAVLRVADESLSTSGIEPTIARASEYLDNAFQRGRIFTDWLMEYNTTSWQRSQSSSQGETDLVEARFHVANAEVYREAMRRLQRATVELNQADNFLRAAEPLLGSHIATEITAVRQRIENAEARNQADRSSQMTRFESIKEDLDQLIDELHSASS
jgi:patatin-like phospholipase/acyl hydrolase